MDSLNFSDISELDTLRRIDNFSDALKLSSFVFSLIPHYTKDRQPIDVCKDVFQYYKLFKENKFFGWCHSNALYLHLLLKKYGRESYVYNYGLKDSDFTHVVTVVTIKESQYLFDPYFNRCYVDEENNPLSFNELLKKIITDPESVKSVYGGGKKAVYFEDNEKFMWMSPQDFEISVLNVWRTLLDFDKTMAENFNNINPLMLIPQKIEKTNLLMKLSGEPYLEFF